MLYIDTRQILRQLETNRSMLLLAMALWLVVQLGELCPSDHNLGLPGEVQAQVCVQDPHLVFKVDQQVLLLHRHRPVNKWLGLQKRGVIFSFI